MREKHVLLPALQCAVAIDPFIRAGANVEFYEVEKDLQIDAEKILSMVNNDTRLIMVVDYFGFPQSELTDLRKQLKERESVLILEDAVQSYLSRIESGLLGTHGHIGLFSLRKCLPVNEGAWLTADDINIENLFNKKNDVERIRRSKPAIGVLRRSLKSFFPKRFSVIPPTTDPFDAPDEVYDCHVPTFRDVFTESVVENTCEKEYRDLRRKNYRLWEKILCEMPDVRPLMKCLPEGISPFAFVCRMKVSHKRNQPD